MPKLIALLGLAGLAACGSVVQRDDAAPAAAGAAIGAGAGEVVSDDPLTGAAIGAGTAVVADEV